MAPPQSAPNTRLPPLTPAPPCVPPRDPSPAPPSTARHRDPSPARNDAWTSPRTLCSSSLSTSPTPSTTPLPVSSHSPHLCHHHLPTVFPPSFHPLSPSHFPRFHRHMKNETSQRTPTNSNIFSTHANWPNNQPTTPPPLPQHHPHPFASSPPSPSLFSTFLSSLKRTSVVGVGFVIQLEKLEIPLFIQKIPSYKKLYIRSKVPKKNHTNYYGASFH